MSEFEYPFPSSFVDHEAEGICTRRFLAPRQNIYQRWTAKLIVLVMRIPEIVFYARSLTQRDRDAIPTRGRA